MVPDDIYTRAGLPLWTGRDWECPHCGEMVPVVEEGQDSGESAWPQAWTAWYFHADYWAVHEQRCPFQWTIDEIDHAEMQLTMRWRNE